MLTGREEGGEYFELFDEAVRRVVVGVYAVEAGGVGGAAEGEVRLVEFNERGKVFLEGCGFF